MKGRIAYERDLARKLYKRGWAVIRAPASGAKNKSYPVPDLVAIKRNYVAVFEVKTTKEEKPIYIPKRQVAILNDWVKRAGAEAFVAVKILDGRGWRLFPIDLLEEKEESYKLVPLNGLTLDELEVRVNSRFSLERWINPQGGLLGTQEQPQ